MLIATPLHDHCQGTNGKYGKEWIESRNIETSHANEQGIALHDLTIGGCTGQFDLDGLYSVRPYCPISRKGNGQLEVRRCLDIKGRLGQIRNDEISLGQFFTVGDLE